MSAFSAKVSCMTDPTNIMSPGVRFQVAEQERVIKVESSVGGYGSLELNECRNSRSGRVTSCTRSYIRHEDREMVTHTVRIYLGSPLSTSYVERDLNIPGLTKVRGEVFTNCVVTR
jgi:hypothetical protein